MASPDKYSAWTEEAAKPADKYAGWSEESAAEKDPGFISDVGHKLAQGFFKGHSDELSGKIGEAFRPADAGVSGPDGHATRPGEDASDVLRDAERSKLEGAARRRPWASGIAQGVGEIGSDVAAQLLGAPVGSLAYQVATGALSGAGNSDEKKGSGVALDAGIGGGLAAGTYGLSRVAGAALRPATAHAREWLRNLGIEQGRRVLLNGADSLSSRVPTSEEAVLEAIHSGAIRPLGTTRGAFQRLEALAEQQGAAYGAIIDELEAQGVRGPEAAQLAAELTRRGAALEPHTLNDALPAEYATRAEQLLRKAGENQRFSLRQNEDLKRSAQEMAKYGRVEDTPLNEVRQDIASALRQGTEDAIEAAGRAAPADSDVRHLADGFVPVKQRLARLIEARRAAQRGAARGDQRRAFGLSDNMLAAAGLASSGPIAGAAWGVGNKLLRDRGTSAVATGALGLSESNAMRQLAGANPAVFGRFAAPASTMGQAGVNALADPDEGRAWSEALPELVQVSPESFGKYGPALARAARKGPEALAAVDFALSKQDPEYQRIKAALLGGGE